jgi:2-oxoglutarate ferredoxin oxidoreductase subunit alpha
MGADAFDLADRLQTPVFVMLDLDIGMNERLCAPLEWIDSRRLDRGKVMNAADLEAGNDFGRYLDVDGDGIPYRTYPGTHPKRGAFFTRGTTKDSRARYSEEGPDYVENMQRLLKKFATAKQLVPRPVRKYAKQPTRFGAIFYGSTSLYLDTLRIRAFPFHDDILDFIAAHDHVFVVEQNRDAQMRTLLMTEGDIDPAKLIKILHYDGTPITARFILREIAQRMADANVVPLRKAAP